MVGRPGGTQIPQVENLVAVHLCPQSATTWRNCPKFPSRVCKTTSFLGMKTFSAAGQAASVLHAMAVLQVHQAKAPKELHESSAELGLMQKLHSATDFALRATKFTVRAFGQTMSTLVALESHLWLNLAEMRELDKVHFLDAA